MAITETTTRQAEFNESALVAAAELAIARVLRDLELLTDALVDDVELTRTEVTNIDSPRRQYLMSVDVRLRRRPGREWQTGEEG